LSFEITVRYLTKYPFQFLTTSTAVAQGTVAQSRIFGGSIAIAVTTIIMNNHLEQVLSADTNLSLPPDALEVLYSSPFRILEYGAVAASDFRESFITTFHDDMRVCMYASIAALIAALATYHTNPPTVAQRSAELEAAVAAYNEANRGVSVVEMGEMNSTV
jgi:hypothetical protein